MEHNSIHRRSRTFPVISQFFLGTKDTTNFLFSCRALQECTVYCASFFFLKLGSEKCRQQKSKSGERIGLTKRKETAAKAKRQIFRQLQGTNGSTSITYKTHAMMSCVSFFFFYQRKKVCITSLFSSSALVFVLFFSPHIQTHTRGESSSRRNPLHAKKNKN